MADQQNPSDSLPDGWIFVSEVTRGGILEYFKNTVTQQVCKTREDLNYYIAYENRANLSQKVDRKQPEEVSCTLCWFNGHTESNCPLSDILTEFNEAWRSKRKGKACSCSGQIKTCHGPSFKK